jgi:ATP-binding cassette subfamily B protein
MNEISNKAALRFLLSYLKKYAPSIYFGLFLLILVDSIQLAIPKVIQYTMDKIGESAYSSHHVLNNALLIIGLAVLMVVFRFFWRYFIVRPSRMIEESMRNDMFNKILFLSSSYFNKSKTGDLMALFINDLNTIRMAIGMGLIGLADATFLSVMSLFFMFSINVKLTLLTVIPLPLIIFIFIKTGSFIQARYTAVQKSFDAISSHTQETFSGIRVIKGFVQETGETDHLKTLCDNYVADNIRLVKLWGILFPSITLLASLSLVFLFYFGSQLVITRELSIGQFISFSFYINLLVWPMVAIGWVFNMMQKGIASSKRVMQLFQTQSDVQVTEQSVQLPEIKGDIHFQNLSFSYTPDGKKVLEDIQLHIPQGTSIGIIGKPGSGKTTLASLICHAYPINRNCLTIDSIDINDIPLQQLRSSISYVPQDSFLFSDTIEANIGFSSINALPEELIIMAAKQAAIHDDISSFTKGYKTKIGERGITLSGGQKQRISIARALLCTSSIIILDDALSAVDIVTERIIQSNIRNVIKGKTSIIIAHRISTIQRCDKIIVLSDGKIIEQGNHEELISRDGFYTRLYELQKLKGLTNNVT